MNDRLTPRSPVTARYYDHDFDAEHQQSDELNHWINHHESLSRCYFYAHIFLKI